MSNRFGKGTCVYSAADIECKEGEANDRFLLEIIRRLLAGRQSAWAEAHPCVWMSVTNQRGEGFLHGEGASPLRPGSVSLPVSSSSVSSSPKGSKTAGRLLVGFLNYPAQPPAIPIANVPFSLRPPKGRKFTRLLSAPTLKRIPFTRRPDGALCAAAKNLEGLQMFLAEYE